MNNKSELLQKLKRFKIPETEYSFDGVTKNDCICVQKNGSEWDVYCYENGEKTIRGTFCRENDANNYLFYLVMKKHVDFKKRWW